MSTDGSGGLAPSFSLEMADPKMLSTWVEALTRLASTNLATARDAAAAAAAGTAAATAAGTAAAPATAAAAAPAAAAMGRGGEGERSPTKLSYEAARSSFVMREERVAPLYLPYISPISPLYLPYISPS